MVKYNDKEIVYTFKYGGYVIKKVKLILFIIPISLIVVGLIIFTVLFINKENGAWESLILSVIGLIFFCIFLILILKEKRQDKKILCWLKDENLYETKAIPWEFSNKVIGFATYHRMGIDFINNEKLNRKISLGYDAFYKNVKDKEITILYSPKYDQVMILKD